MRGAARRLEADSVSAAASASDAVRRNALDRVRALGLPGPGQEGWRYTNVAPLAMARPLASGGYTVLSLPAGVSVHSLSDPTLPEGEDRPFALLNAALCAGELVLRVAAGTVPDRPVRLAASASSYGQVHPRCRIVVEAGASLTVVEHHYGSGSSLSNSFVAVELGDGAALDHVKIQDCSPDTHHIATLDLAQGNRAAYRGFLLHLGGRLARHEVRARLDGEAADFALDGAILGGGSQVLDLTTTVLHRAPACRSRQVVKLVLDGAARGVFQGKVVVEPGAQKTDAHQLCRALLLSPTAEADAKPELEIYADDVKCGHGAAVGALDEDALFALLSRGIPPDQARRLLVEGFLAELVERIASDALRDEVAGLVRGRLEEGR